MSSEVAEKIGRAIGSTTCAQAWITPLSAIQRLTLQTVASIPPYAHCTLPIAGHCQTSKIPRLSSCRKNGCFFPRSAYNEIEKSLFFSR